jgi:hypothetical protein
MSDAHTHARDISTSCLACHKRPQKDAPRRLWHLLLSNQHMSSKEDCAHCQRERAWDASWGWDARGVGLSLTTASTSDDCEYIQSEDCEYVQRRRSQVEV